ncbi:MAG: MDR/zinc-dependent alcohol dehydrogenase-like family protein [Pyrinomonadaceae bacterium]
MKALRFTGGELAIADVPIPERAGEALVRVTLSGVCNTDLEIVRGYAGFEGTIGHEFVGVVEDAPDRPSLVGRRVVGEINAGCGRCPRCAAGDPRHCPERTVLGIHGRDGAHAEYLALPAANLLELPAAVTDEHAVFTEPLAAALGIVERVAVEPGARAAVIGDGKLGILCAWAIASVHDREVLLIGKHRRKLERAAAEGVRTCLLDEIAGISSEFDIVVEASGSESGFETAVELTRPRGTIVLKSTFQGVTNWPASRIVVDEIAVVGSRCGRFAPAIEALAAGAFDLSRLIDSEYRLADGVAAMHHAGEAGVLKVLLRP